MHPKVERSFVVNYLEMENPMTAKLLLPSRILIVDDHSMVREGLRLRIEAFQISKFAEKPQRKMKPWSWSKRLLRS